MWKDATGAAFLKFLGRGSVRKEVADAVFLKFKRGFIRGIRPAELAARKPASIGRLRAGRPGTRVNSGLAARQAGKACKYWASGQPFRRGPFYAGFGADVVEDIVMVLWWLCGCWR